MIHIPFSIQKRKKGIPSLTRDTLDPSAVWDVNMYQYDPDALKIWLETYRSKDFEILTEERKTQKIFKYKGKKTKDIKHGEGAIYYADLYAKKKSMGGLFSNKATLSEMLSGIRYSGNF